MLFIIQTNNGYWYDDDYFTIMCDEFVARIITFLKHLFVFISRIMEIMKWHAAKWMNVVMWFYTLYKKCWVTVVVWVLASICWNVFKSQINVIFNLRARPVEVVIVSSTSTVPHVFLGDRMNPSALRLDVVRYGHMTSLIEVSSGPDFIVDCWVDCLHLSTEYYKIRLLHSVSCWPRFSK